jgi:6-phosphogluconolactonase/glucosamine-6-phosphate isomerase/deaminase
VPLESLRTIDGSATDLAAEAARHEAVLEAAPINVAVPGLGRDGHVAFDEPPAKMASGSAGRGPRGRYPRGPGAGLPRP